jgi:hypothetical protein
MIKSAPNRDDINRKKEAVLMRSGDKNMSECFFDLPSERARVKIKDWGQI